MAGFIYGVLKNLHRNRSRYEDVMNQNPFHEEPRGRHSNEHEMRNIKASKSNDAYHNFSGQPTYKPRAMYHSQSESNITYSTDSSAFSRPLLHSESFSGGTPSTRLTHQMGSAPRSPQRRWPSTRTPSPTKRLPDLPNLEENEELNFPMTPTKRSRSPTKRMFGEKGWLNQSPSAKDASSEQNRKTGIKALGGKIKQRMGDLVSLASTHVVNFEAKLPIRRTSPGRFPTSSRATVFLGWTLSRSLHSPSRWMRRLSQSS